MGMAGKFRLRRKAGNGQTVTAGEAYETLASARVGCAAMVRGQPHKRDRPRTTLNTQQRLTPSAAMT